MSDEKFEEEKRVPNGNAEKWQRAKAYIEREIEYHQRAIDAGGLGLDALYTHAVKRDVYQEILDRAEGRDE